MGAALGREGAPKQAGAVLANVVTDRVRLSDEERRLPVACGAGAGMAAAYGVPLGGTLFALEMLRGALALRFVLPALVTSLVATEISWASLPDAPTYDIPAFNGSMSVAVRALLAGPLVGLVSAAYVRSVAWTDGRQPKGWRRLLAPVLAPGTFGGSLNRPAATARQWARCGETGPQRSYCPVAAGKPGGHAPGCHHPLSRQRRARRIVHPVLGFWCSSGQRAKRALVMALARRAARAVHTAGCLVHVGATTQGPVLAVVLVMELTGHARAAIVPILLMVATATLVARTIEPRSIYDARLMDAQVGDRQRARDPG